MNRSAFGSFLLGGLMLLSAVAAKVLTPTNLLADSQPRPPLESTIPAAFGDWTEETARSAQIINPQIEQVLNRIYAQTLSRTYVNHKGERVMLSVAYGTDQRRVNEVHYPEVCYPAQGFQVTAAHTARIATTAGTLPVNRLETNLAEQRFEPLTYWTTIGNQITPGGMDKRLKELAFGVRGEIPDGLVFRVSSIDHDAAAAFRLQEKFLQALVPVLAPQDRNWLAGL